MVAIAASASAAPPPKPPHASLVAVGWAHKQYATPCQDLVVSRALPAAALHAVLDGHGPAGDRVARRAAAALADAADDALRKARAAPLAPHAPHADALRTAFAAAAEAVDADDAAAVSGTTASVALFAPPLLTVANVGDSTVVWAKGGKEARVVSRDHRLSDAEERARVEAVGGVVLNGFLSNGDPWGKAISITRALGDLDCRALGVVAEPHVREVRLEGEDDFVILATDGLWDAHGGVSPQQAVDRVRECFEQETSLQFACEELLRLAKRGSDAPGDDFAVVLVTLGRR